MCSSDLDLVVLSVDSVKSADIRAALMALKIPVVMEKAPRNINGAYSEMLTLGRATGHASEARARIVSMKQRIAAIIRAAKITAPVRFFHELDNTLYSATTTTFIGQVYRQIAPRSVNVADAAASADSGGYPQLSAEYLVSSNPQVIFLADAQYGESAQTVKGRAAFAGIDAVVKNKVIALPADIPSRWGPRLVTLYAFIAKALARVQSS